MLTSTSVQHAHADDTTTSTVVSEEEEESSALLVMAALPDFLRENGNGGEVKIVGGRICLAHEDAKGFADEMIDLLQPPP